MEITTAVFTIYSQKLAGYLMQRGFCLFRMVHYPASGYNKFLFRNSEELHHAINQWHINREKQRGQE